LLTHLIQASLESLVLLQLIVVLFLRNSNVGLHLLHHR